MEMKEGRRERKDGSQINCFIYNEYGISKATQNLIIVNLKFLALYSDVLNGLSSLLVFGT